MDRVRPPPRSRALLLNVRHRMALDSKAELQGLSSVAEETPSTGSSPLAGRRISAQEVTYEMPAKQRRPAARDGFAYEPQAMPAKSPPLCDAGASPLASRARPLALQHAATLWDSGLATDPAPPLPHGVLKQAAYFLHWADCQGVDACRLPPSLALPGLGGVVAGATCEQPVDAGASPTARLSNNSNSRMCRSRESGLLRQASLGERLREQLADQVLDIRVARNLALQSRVGELSATHAPPSLNLVLDDEVSKPTALVVARSCFEPGDDPPRL